ncbi:hypothetical protein RNZ50_05940 [Paracoccaceae bacterium Fryx2]|nr:hypothetical protein [Paracoccaceae bacterium Fryx2]
MISLAVGAAGWVGFSSPGDYAAFKFPPLPRHHQVLCRQKVRELCPRLTVFFAVEPFHWRVLARPVQSLDLTVGPRVVGVGQAVIEGVGLADHDEAHRPGIAGVAVPGLPGELDAIVGQYGVDLLWHGFEHVLQELPGSFLSAVATS